MYELAMILIVTMKLNRDKQTKANCCPTAFMVKKQKSKNKIRQKPSKTKKLFGISGVGAKIFLRTVYSPYKHQIF